MGGKSSEREVSLASGRNVAEALASLGTYEVVSIDLTEESLNALPPGIDYASIGGLRLEARQKLAEIRPLSLGQAERISGVSPADIAVLLIYLEQNDL